MIKKIIRYTLLLILIFLLIILWKNWEKENNLKNKTPNITHIQNLNTIQESSISKQNITIKTDVLDLNIDLKNGKINKSKLLKYKQTNKNKNNVILLNNNKNNLFYVNNIISELTNKNQKKELTLNFSANQKEYFLNTNQKKLIITLNTINKNLIIKKIFTFIKGSYDIKIETSITNKNNYTWHGTSYLNITKKFENPKKSFFMMRSFSGLSIFNNNNYEKYDLNKLLEKPIELSDKTDWFGIVDHYFIIALVPQENNYYFYTTTENNLISFNLINEKIKINSNETFTLINHLYIGPKITENLNKLSPTLTKTIDYGHLSYISNILFWLLKYIYKITKNWGVAIILLTLLIKLIFYKLSASSYKSMAAMRKLQPKLTQLKEQHADNKQELSKATIELYRKEKINPLGGCLPILIQIPVFFALYYVLIESVELRQAPFIFWIHDLSVKDPYYVLPILMGLSMFLTQKISPQSPDPTQAKVMMFLPVIMTIFFLQFPAGLVLYWVSNNILSLIQQWYIMKKYDPTKINKNKIKQKKYK